MQHPNRVREHRLARAFTREDLAQRIGVTRQTVGLIEAGRVSPSASVAVRLAKSLNTTVERLFDEDSGELIARFYAGVGPMEDVTDESHQHSPTIQPSNHLAMANTDGTRVVVSSIRNEWIARPCTTDQGAYPLQPAHGLAYGIKSGFAQVQPLRETDGSPKTLFISGCDLGLGLLASRLDRTARQFDGVWFQTSNQAALAELANGVTHVAAIHTARVDDFTDSLLPFPVQSFQFSSGQLGWVVQKGNPKGFQGAEDLADGRFRLVNRGTGAGCRTLLDAKMNQAGICEYHVPGYQQVVRGHQEVAQWIELGLADVGIAHEVVKAFAKVDFIPIQSETCLLLIPEREFDKNVTQVLMDTLHSGHFRQDLAAIGPYDVSQMGQQIKP